MLPMVTSDATVTIGVECEDSYRAISTLETTVSLSKTNMSGETAAALALLTSSFPTDPDLNAILAYSESFRNMLTAGEEVHTSVSKAEASALAARHI